MKRRRVEVVEARTTVVDTSNLRRAISALDAAANIAAEALYQGADDKERFRGRKVIEECVSGLSALAFAQIPKEPR